MQPLVDTNDLDAVRAVLSSLASRGEGHAKPVSATAMQSELQRRLKELPVSNLLYELVKVRDVQSLGRGFWLPAPTHVVTCTHFGILVSGLPIQELTRRHGYEPLSLGASRLLIGGCTYLQSIPTTSFSDWLEAPSSTIEWTEAVVRSARYVPPLGMSGVEVFRHWTANGPNRWSSISDAILPPSGTVLARHRGRTGQTNHYLLQLTRKRITAMSELQHQSDFVLRLQFGLRALAGESPRIRLRLTPRQNLMAVETPPLPAAEYRLLLALGELSVDLTTGGLRAIIHEATAQEATRALISLGCQDEGGAP